MKKIDAFRMGQEIFFSGTLYVARDQAHKRLVEAIKKRKSLPFELKEAIIYYSGPTQTSPGKVIGACGPTTSSRMDEFSPRLLKHGIKGMIGKGDRSVEVQQALKKYKGTYFITYAGCGALLSKYVKSVKKIAYADLGPEAILKLEVENFPLIVAIDCLGNNIYKRLNIS